MSLLFVQVIGVPLAAASADQAESNANIDSVISGLPNDEDNHDDETSRTFDKHADQWLEDNDIQIKDAQYAEVTFEKRGDSDYLSIEHPEDFFDNLSFDNLLGITREGDGNLEHLQKIEVDGQILTEKDYHILKHTGIQHILIDGNKLHSNPPKKIDLLMETSGNAEYRMMLREELPARAVLNEDGLFLEDGGTDQNQGNRSAGQCEPNGNIITSAKSVKVNRQIYNHNQLGSDELFVTLSGLTPGETINEIVFLQNSNFHINEGARALLFEDGEGRLTKANQERDNHRPISNIVVRDKGPNDTDQSLILEFAPVKIGPTGEISVVIPSRNAVGYGLRAQVNKILDFGAYADPVQEADLATALPKRALSPTEKYGGTKVYFSENSDQNQLGQAPTSLFVQSKGIKDHKKLGASQWSYNGLAFDARDNWLYAVSNSGEGQNSNCYPAGHLLQINPVTGKVRNLGPLRGPEGGEIFNDSVVEDGKQIRDRKQINAGTIYDGYLYVSSSTETGSKKIYRITSPSKGKFRNGEPVIERTTFESYSADYVQLPKQNRYLWGLIGTDARKRAPRWHSLARFSSSNILVERIDLYNGATDYFEIPEANARTISGKTIKNPREWGKAWSYGNGNLGFASEGLSSDEARAVRLEISEASSNAPQIKVLEVAKDFSQAMNSDSTSNSDRSQFLASDLEVKKKQLVGPLNSIDQERVNALKNQGANTPGYYYWLIDIKNNGQGASSGSVVHDLLPNVFDLSSIRFEKKGLSGNLSDNPVSINMNGFSLQQTEKSWDLEFSVGEIEAGKSLRLYLAARLSPGKACAPNKVSILNDDVDSNNANHTAVADCVKEDTRVDFNVDMVDFGSLSNGTMPKMLTGGNFELVEGKKGEIHLNKADHRSWTSPLIEDGSTGKYRSTQKLTVGKYYWLVEKQPPHDATNGRTYLPIDEPQLFRLEQDTAQHVKVEFFNRNNTHNCPVVDGWASCSQIAKSLVDPTPSSSVSIQISRSPSALQPELPKTGGNGVIGYVLFGVIIIVWGTALLHRKFLVRKLV